MKHALVLCLFSAFFNSLANGDCTTACQNLFLSYSQGVISEAQICQVARAYYDCLQASCNVDLTQVKIFIGSTLNLKGISCDFFNSFTIGDCTTACQNPFLSYSQGVISEAQICPKAQTYYDCLGASCNVDLSLAKKLMDSVLKSEGISCDSGSKAVSSSFLTVLCTVLITVYKIFL